MNGYIYKITNNITKQSYIGQTIDIKRRRREHIHLLEEGRHENPLLQNSWNVYGEENFSFEYWTFNIEDGDELNKLECEYIEKYDSLNSGFNLVEGGGKPPLRQKVRDEDVVTCLCALSYLGDGYGKSIEQYFNWAKGTSSKIKLRKGYLNAQGLFDEMSEEEKVKTAKAFIEKSNLLEIKKQREEKQGGCKKAYSLTEDDFNFAFAAQELGYKYTPVAQYLEIKPNTVKDWFNGRARKKAKAKYLELSEMEKEKIKDKVKEAHLESIGHDHFLKTKEEDIIIFLCADTFFHDIIPLSVYDDYFGWSRGYTTKINQENMFPITKAKVALMSKQEKLKIATAFYSHCRV